MNMKARDPFVGFTAACTLLLAACATSPAPSSPAPAATPRSAEGAAAAAAPVTPAMLAGNWLFEMKMGGRSVEGSLHFGVTSGVLVGTFTRSDGNEQELKNIEIKENVVTWDVEGGGGGKQHAKATVEGSSMKGTLKRSGGGRGGRGGGNPDGETGESGDSAPPREGGGGRRGGRGGGGRRGGRGGTTEIAFIAYKSVPPVETTAPPATPTPPP